MSMTKKRYRICWHYVGNVANIMYGDWCYHPLNYKVERLNASDKSCRYWEEVEG